MNFCFSDASYPHLLGGHGFFGSCIVPRKGIEPLLFYVRSVVPSPLGERGVGQFIFVRQNMATAAIKTPTSHAKRRIAFESVGAGTGSQGDGLSVQPHLNASRLTIC